VSGADVEREAELQAEMRKRWRHELAWSLYATSYDRVLLEMPYYQEVLARHHAAMTRSDVRTVLDVGGGTGNVTLPLLAAGRRVTVVDKSRAMLEHLRAKLEVRPKARDERSLTILEKSAEELDELVAESFDGSTILLSLYDMAAPDRALAHAVRSLRAGGTLVVTEPRRRFELAPILAEVERVLRAKSLWPALQRDWQRVRDANVELDPSASRPAPRTGRVFIEDIAAILDRQGFAIEGPRDSHLGNCATIVATKPLPPIGSRPIELH